MNVSLPLTLSCLAGALSTTEVVLSPDAGWDGSLNSGFATGTAAPTDPTRTTAKPVVLVLDPPNQTTTDELTISVMALANDSGTLIGGIEKIRFNLEGNTADVSAQTLRTFTRFDASTYKVPCYTVTLKKPDGINGQANLYVEVFPTDATMQNRVLGPITYHFNSTLHDIELEVAPSLAVIAGQRYQSLGAAIAYIRGVSLTPRNPKITITEAGNYDFTGAGFGYVNPASFLTITATAAATLGYQSAQSSDTTALLRPNIDRLWIEGPNITLDFKYTLQFYAEQANRPHVFNGCNITNSFTRESYWRLSTRPISPFRLRHYFLDCNISELDNAAANAFLARGNVFTQTTGDIGQGAQALVCNTVDDHTGVFFARDVSALSVTGPAGATLSSTGSHNADHAMTAKVSGSTVGTFSIQTSSAAWTANTNYTVQNVADWINTLSGWSATVLDNTRRAAVLSVPGTSGVQFTDVDVSSPTTFSTMFDMHCDFYQQSVGIAAQAQNVLVYGNWGIAWSGQVMLPAGNSPGMSDTLFANNSFYTNPDNSTPYQVNSAFFSQFAYSQSHMLFVHNTLANQGVLLRDDISLSWDAYTLFANNSVRSARWNSAAVGSGTVIDNHVHYNALGNNSPQGATGTVSLGDESTLYTSAATGNFTPAGDLLTNKKTSRITYDVYGDTFGTTDAVGAVAS